MDIKLALRITQLIVSIIIVTLVMLQQQDSGFYSQNSNINRTKRGTEKLVHNLTIVFGLIFTIVSIANFTI